MRDFLVAAEYNRMDETSRGEEHLKTNYWRGQGSMLAVAPLKKLQGVWKIGKTGKGKGDRSVSDNKNCETGNLRYHDVERAFSVSQEWEMGKRCREVEVLVAYTALFRCPADGKCWSVSVYSTTCCNKTGSVRMTQ
jgi:hypothetical protein